MGNFDHDAFTDPSWVDPASYQGKITDPSVLLTNLRYGFSLNKQAPKITIMMVSTDLDDLDDDNDGIDLIERFDGCYGTDPFRADNDGISDEDDWDDDNDGILEVDLITPKERSTWNISADRYVGQTRCTLGQSAPVGTGYRIGQNPMDHDNDGVTDEDIDGSGRGFV